MKKNNNGILKSIGALFLAGILAAGICCMGFASRNDDGKWFKNGNLSTWHWSDKTDDNKPGDNNSDDETENAGGAIVGEAESNGIALLSAVLPRSAYAANDIDMQSDTAYILTATVLPAETDDKTVDWSVSWEDADSTWASGKAVANYLTVTPTSDGALTATLTCKQAFGEQAVITVVSRAASNVKATANVDYRKRLVSSTTGIFDGSTSSTKSWNFENDLFVNTTTFVDNFGVGTLDDTVVSHKMTITTHSTLRNQLSSQFTSTSARNAYMATREYDGGHNLSQGHMFLTRYSLFWPKPETGSGVSGVEGLFSFCSELVNYGQWEILTSQYNKVRTCLMNSAIDFVITIKTELTYGGTVTATYNVNVLDSSLSILPTSLSLDNSSFVF